MIELHLEIFCNSQTDKALVQEDSIMVDPWCILQILLKYCTYF